MLLFYICPVTYATGLHDRHQGYFQFLDQILQPSQLRTLVVSLDQHPVTDTDYQYSLSVHC